MSDYYPDDAPEEGFPPAPDAIRPGRFPPLDEATVAGLRQQAIESVRAQYPGVLPVTQEAYVEQILRGIRWLAVVWGPNKPCPYCGNVEWTVNPQVQLATRPIRRYQTTGYLAPVLPVICTNCGNTVLINEAHTRQVDEQQ